MSALSRLAYRSSFLAMSSIVSVGSALAQGSTAGTLGGFPTVLPGSDQGNANGIRRIVVNLLNIVLNFLALVAVIFIVIAGIRLIVSQGEEEQKNKAKKTIIYVAIGLIVILLAKVLVNFVTSTFLNI